MLAVAQQRTAQKRQSQILSVDDITPHLHIMDKRDVMIPFIPNRIQRHFAQHRTMRDLVLKSRQVGFTTYCRAYDFAISQVKPSRQLVIADKSDNTQKLRRMNDRFYDYLPERYKIGRTADNASTTVYANGSEVSIDTAGSSSAGRASTFRRLHASEVAFWKNAGNVMTGILNTLPLDGYAVAESTPNGSVGWFYDECMAALNGESVWTLHFYEWWWSEDNQLTESELIAHGLEHLIHLPYTDEEVELIAKHGLTQEQLYWRRYKIKEDPVKFKQEHPENVYDCFLASGQSYFGDVESCFNAPENATYNPDHQYFAGLDFGQDQDFTALKIIEHFMQDDKPVYREVDQLRINKMRWDDMRYRVVQKLLEWHVGLCLAEWNSIGKVNIEHLIDDLADSDTRVRAFKTTAISKPPLIQGLYAALHEHGLQMLPDDTTRHEFRNFISKQTPSGNWQYEAAEGSHDDTVIATALAWVAVMRGNQTIEAI